MPTEIRTIYVRAHEVKAYSYQKVFTIKSPGAKKPRARARAKKSKAKR